MAKYDIITQSDWLEGRSCIDQEKATMFKKKAEEDKKVETAAEAKGDAGEASKAGAAGNSSDASKASDASGSSASSCDAGKASDTDTASDASEPSAAAPEKPAEPDWKTLYAVTLADFDNYKTRAARDREDVYRYAESDILKDVLPTVDNLALALASGKNSTSGSGKDSASPLGDEHPFVKGVQMVYDGLLKALADHGAKPMDDLIGKELDPNFHEAIATLPSADVEEGKISNVAKTGWTLNDKLLRAAQVVVSAGAPA